jgi:hypothetical protein
MGPGTRERRRWHGRRSADTRRAADVGSSSPSRRATHAGLGYLMTDGMPVVTALPPSATPHRAGANRARERPCPARYPRIEPCCPSQTPTVTARSPVGTNPPGGSRLGTGPRRHAWIRSVLPSRCDGESPRPAPSRGRPDQFFARAVFCCRLGPFRIKVATEDAGSRQAHRPADQLHEYRLQLLPLLVRLSGR